MENCGFRFRPTHQECILYLAFKVTGRPFPSHVTIPDRDPYNLQELAGIFLDAEKNGYLFFFTKPSTKGKTGSKNANRTVGNGTWHGDRTEPVEHRGRKLGKYTKLSYEEKGSKYDKRFTMKEYSLPKKTRIRYDPFKHYVLCHLEISKSNRECMTVSNEIIPDHVPDADEAHHVAAVGSVELPSDQIFGESIYDQQPLPMQETAGFRNFETLQDGQSLVQRDNGWANDQTATYTPISDHNSGNYCSCAFGNQLQVPLRIQTHAAMFDNGLPPLPGLINVDSDYPPSSTFDYSSLYPKPLAVEAQSHLFDETHLTPDMNSLNQSKCDVGSASQPCTSVVYNNGLPPLLGGFYGDFRHPPNYPLDRSSFDPRPAPVDAVKPHDPPADFSKFETLQDNAVKPHEPPDYFRKFKSLQDTANDPLLYPPTANFTAISDNNTPYQYSCKAGYPSARLQPLDETTLSTL